MKRLVYYLRCLVDNLSKKPILDKPWQFYFPYFWYSTTQQIAYTNKLLKKE